MSDTITVQSDWQSGGFGTILRNDATVSYYANTFLMDESVNKRRWAVSYDSMKRHLESFVGQPVVMIPSRSHPSADMQEMFRVGGIESVHLNDSKKASGAYVSVNADAAALIYNKLVHHTSVQLTVNREKMIRVNADTPFQYDLCEEWRGEHVALVESPAYGRDKAYIDKVCQGTAQQCRMELPLSAAMPKDPHATEGQAALARTIERSIRRLYAPCTIRRIVKDAKSGSDLRRISEKYPKLTPSETLAMAVNSPSMSASLDSMITAYVTGFLKE